MGKKHPMLAERLPLLEQLHRRIKEKGSTLEPPAKPPRVAYRKKIEPVVKQPGTSNGKIIIHSPSSASKLQLKVSIPLVNGFMFETFHAKNVEPPSVRGMIRRSKGGF